MREKEVVEEQLYLRDHPELPRIVEGGEALGVPRRHFPFERPLPGEIELLGKAGHAHGIGVVRPAYGERLKPLVLVAEHKHGVGQAFGLRYAVPGSLRPRLGREDLRAVP